MIDKTVFFLYTRMHLKKKRERELLDHYLDSNDFSRQNEILKHVGGELKKNKIILPTKIKKICKQYRLTVPHDKKL